MRRWPAIIIVVVAGISIGCFDISVEDGAVKCNPGPRPCPEGFFCAQGACYRNGHTLPSSFRDMAIAPAIRDMAGPADMSVLKAKGTSCTKDGDCASGHCTDGVCCDQACGGQCQACDVTPGTCTPIVGQPHGTRTRCSGTGACAATCNGIALSCTFPGAQVACGTQSCGGSPPTLMYSATCNGAGQCIPTGNTMSTPCPTPANGTAICTGNQCDFMCNAPYQKSVTSCAAVFTTQTSNTTADLSSVWGSSSADVYVGGYDNSASKAVMLHLASAASWSSGAMPSGCLGVFGIWGSGSTNIYGVSTVGNTYHSAGSQVFSQLPNTNAADDWWAIWGDGVYNSIYIVGGRGGTTPVARIAMFNSGSESWTDQNPGISSAVAFRGVWGSSYRDIYAVTDDGRIMHSDGSGKWTQQTINGTSKPLYGIWGSDASHVYAVGDAGIVLFSTGNGQWQPQASGTTLDLRGVWGSGASDVYVIGKTGTIIHSAGDGSWTPQVSNVSEDLTAIWGDSPTNIYVVGSAGTIAHFP